MQVKGTATFSSRVQQVLGHRRLSGLWTYTIRWDTTMLIAEVASFFTLAAYGGEPSLDQKMDGSARLFAPSATQ